MRTVEDFAAPSDSCFGGDMSERDPTDPEPTLPPGAAELRPHTFRRERPPAKPEPAVPPRSMRELPHLRPQYADDRRYP
jgi:hypothetical protein